MMENKQSVVILLGPPGSGKGTQAKRIAEEKHLPHISTGDLFRYNIKHQTPLGEKAKAFMDYGQLVPDDVVLDMFSDRVAQEDCKEGYLLDGFPRTIPQAESLDSLLDSNVEVVVIKLDVSNEVIIRRLSGRMSCNSCGHVQNHNSKSSNEEGKCEKCGGDLYQRVDDKPEVVKERLNVYTRQTAPLIDYYSSKDLLHTVNGERDAEDVFKDLMDLIPG